MKAFLRSFLVRRLPPLGYLTERSGSDLMVFYYLSVEEVREIRKELYKHGFYFIDEGPNKLKWNINILGLTIESQIVLYNAGIRTIQQLIQNKAGNLRRIGIGDEALARIRARGLREHDLYLKGDHAMSNAELLTPKLSIDDLGLSRSTQDLLRHRGIKNN